MLSEDNSCSLAYILTWSFYSVSYLEGLRSCNNLNFRVLEKASSRTGKFEPVKMGKGEKDNT